MKWFKHISDSGDDPDIDSSNILFGSDGPWAFFRTLEIMTREFDIKNPGVNTFLWDFFRKKFRISAKKLRKILHFFDEKKRIFSRFYDLNGKEMIELKCPKLKELCDEYTQKQLFKMSGQTPDPNRDLLPTIEAEAETEAEKDNKSITSVMQQVAQKTPKKDISFFIDLLKKYSIRGDQAKKYVENISLEMIAKQILLYVYYKDNGKDIDNPIGFLRTLLEYPEKYPEPEAFHKYKKQKAQSLLKSKEDNLKIWGAYL